MDGDLGEQEAELDPPKVRGSCALANKSMRLGVRIDWPERSRRSLKRSCHGPAIGLPEEGEFRGTSARCVRAVAGSLDPTGKFKCGRDLRWR